jgi:hypothetical protein
MSSSITIRDMFKLGGGMTVLACDRYNTDISWENRFVDIVSDEGDVRQRVKIIGEREMLKQTEKLDQIALDTTDDVMLDGNEARNGKWMIRL